MFAYPDSLDAVDPTNPLAEHPLNEGLVAWWLGLPPLDGGAAWYDLCSGNQSRALTPTGGPTWTPTPSGVSGWRLNGTSQYLSNSSFGSSFLAGNMTIIIWSNCSNPSASVSSGICGQGTGTNWELKVNPSSPIMRALIYIGSAQVIVSDPNTFGSGWIRWGFTINGAAVSLYRNGVQVATGSGANSTHNPGGTIYAGIGQTGAISFWPGSVTDFKAYGRALSPAEMSADYDLSQRGYPGVLRRNRPLSAFVGASVAPTGGVSGD